MYKVGDTLVHNKERRLFTIDKVEDDERYSTMGGEPVEYYLHNGYPKFLSFTEVERDWKLLPKPKYKVGDKIIYNESEVYYIISNDRGLYHYKGKRDYNCNVAWYDFLENRSHII